MKLTDMQASVSFCAAHLCYNKRRRCLLYETIRLHRRYLSTKIRRGWLLFGERLQSYPDNQWNRLVEGLGFGFELGGRYVP